MIVPDVNKGMGPDQICSRFLQTLAEIHFTVYADLFNLTLVKGMVPSDWPTVIMFSIFKKNDSKDT